MQRLQRSQRTLKLTKRTLLITILRYVHKCFERIVNFVDKPSLFYDPYYRSRSALMKSHNRRQRNKRPRNLNLRRHLLKLSQHSLKFRLPKIQSRYKQLLDQNRRLPRCHPFLYLATRQRQQLLLPPLLQHLMLLSAVRCSPQLNSLRPTPKLTKSTKRQCVNEYKRSNSE